MRSFIFNSNSIRLKPVEWVLAAFMIGVVFVCVPPLWECLEDVEYGTYYRVPHEMSNNYWFIKRWMREVSNEFDAVIIGDSVVWGHYTAPGGSLSAHSTRLSDGKVFANLGIDGLHPAAMPGFLRYYAGVLRDKKVILHLNLLWMSSKRHDLRVEEEFRFNHPRLVPQVFPDIPCYNPSVSEIIGASAEKRIPFISWVQHLRQTYFENMDLIGWTLMNPLENPLREINFKVPEPENRPRSEPRSWEEAGIQGGREKEWVEKEESFQWKSFKEAIRILEARGNEVIVVLGPFNEHMLDKDNRRRYRALAEDVSEWLGREGVAFYEFELLPSGLMADASHPLEEGYRLMAEELFEKAVIKDVLRRGTGSPEDRPVPRTRVKSVRARAN